MDPTPFLVIGAVLAVIGIVIILANLKSMRRRRRILDTPTSKIAQASGAGLVEIFGAIKPSEQGVFAAPFSGRPAVWARVIVQEHRGSGKNSRWVTIVSEVAERVFLVDDGSGQAARVFPTGAEVLLQPQKVASSGTFNDAPPQLVEFLAQRGVATTGFLGFNKSLRYEEALLCPEDPIYALGPSYREGGPGAGAFRDAPPGQLVLKAGNT
ncbi:MAG: hypothetical protein ABI175_24575, partial [Polyangiales bacterium]